MGLLMVSCPSACLTQDAGAQPLLVYSARPYQLVLGLLGPSVVPHTRSGTHGLEVGSWPPH